MKNIDFFNRKCTKQIKILTFKAKNRKKSCYLAYKVVQIYPSMRKHSVSPVFGSYSADTLRKSLSIKTKP